MTTVVYRDAYRADAAFLSKMIFVAWRWDRARDRTATRLDGRLGFRRHDGLDSGTVMLLPL